jgi:hypothetical protein
MILQAWHLVAAVIFLGGLWAWCEGELAGMSFLGIVAVLWVIGFTTNGFHLPHA